ncbi:MAG: DUF1826 domain-containing protein [Pseudomonadales bacterium]|nr:DUF1826 domain-containing protein [Pseudomonadales bacterium]MBO7004999.1 DUF1826 domain-containing protein [Pseudomonadales bacterium]
MMRHLLSDHVVDFSAIYDDDVELVSIERPRSSALDALADSLFTSRKVLDIHWEQAANDAHAPFNALKNAVQGSWLSALSEEIIMANEILKELLGCDRVGVRVATLSSPMCPRFHVDQVPCRMLMTVSGGGTEWIASNDVVPELLANRKSSEPPLTSGGTIRQFTKGSWSLLKGGTWHDRFRGVVHRSPHQAGERLLLSFDPVFKR